MEKNTVDINFTEIGVSAITKMESVTAENGKNRIGLIVEDQENRYIVTISKGNARWLIDKLLAAIELA